MKNLVLSLAILLSLQGVALAGPPASCRDKFVGTWTYFGGSTLVKPNGIAIPSVGVDYQTWTCDGNKYIFSNPDGQTWTQTLSPDGNKLLGVVTATRLGAKKADARKISAAKTTEKKEAACILVGGKRAIDCMNESGGKHCVCLTLENKCAYTVQVFWKTTSEKNKKSDSVGPGKTHKSACTGAENASITYLGHRRLK